MNISSIRFNPTTVLVVSLIAILLAIIAFFYFQEWVEVTYQRQLSEEAKKNRFLAMEQYLRKREISFTRENNLETVFENADSALVTIYLPIRLSILNPNQVDLVLNWVESGGTLIYKPNRVFDENDARKNDPILDRLGYRLDRSFARTNQNSGSKIKTFEEGCTQEPGALLQVKLNEEVFETDLSRYNTYSKAESQGFSIPQHVVAIQREAGWVVLIPSDTQWDNHFFLCHDNSKLLYSILTINKHLSLVNSFIWLESDAYIWWTDRLWENYPIQILLLLVIFVLWVRKVSVQHLRQFPPASDGPRSVNDYVTSVSYFQWKAGVGVELLNEMRRSILQKTKSKNPSHAVEEVMKSSTLLRDDIQRALLSNSSLTKREFVEIVRILRQLRMEL